VEFLDLKAIASQNFVCLVVVLEIEPRASQMLTKHSTIELNPQPPNFDHVLVDRFFSLYF
jgi:hypothetical protein